MANKNLIKNILVNTSKKYVKNRNKRVDRVDQAELPNLLLDDLPIVIDKRATLNIIFGDSGVGKTLLNQAIIRSVLEQDQEKKYYILWFDLEFQEGASKQRGVNELLKLYPDNFDVGWYDEETAEDFYKETGREWTNTRMVFHLTHRYRYEFPDKHLLVFVDSLEDFINDTSSDDEVKSVFSHLLSLQNISFIFAHHINKKTESLSGLKFRGSMVIKNKANSMIYIEKRTDPDDETIEYTLDITKMRTMWHGSRKILITVEKPALRIKSINLNSNSAERKVLRSAYFMLKKENELPKTELIERISKEVKINAKAVRSIIDKNIDLFTVSSVSRNKHTFQINAKTLEEFHVAIGLDNSLSDTKKDLLRLLSDCPIDYLVNFAVEREDGTQIGMKTAQSIKNNIYKISELEAESLRNALKELLSKDPKRSGNPNLIILKPVKKIDEKELKTAIHQMAIQLGVSDPDPKFTVEYLYDGSLKRFTKPSEILKQLDSFKPDELYTIHRQLKSILSKMPVNAVYDDEVANGNDRW